MAYMIYRPLWRASLLMLCMVPLALPAWSAATDYALLMPKASTSLLLDIAAAGDKLVAVGERGHILYSDNQGQSWVQARVPTSVMLTRVFFINDNLGWAVGHDGNIVVSHDGGVNWTLQRDGVTEQAQFNEERVSMAKQVVAELREELSHPAGEAGAQLLQQVKEADHALEVARDIMREPVYAPPLMDVWFSDEQQGWAAGAFGTLLRTSNGGRSWEDWSYKVENPEELHFNGVAGDDTGAVYLASEWGYVFRSDSGGESWKIVETGYDGSFFGVEVNPTSGSVFAYGLLGTIYRSRDLGNSWQALESGTRGSLFGAAVAADGSMVFVGLDGAVQLTRDDGNSFVTLNQGPRRSLLGVAPLRSGSFMVTGAGGSAPLDNITGTGR